MSFVKGMNDYRLNQYNNFCVESRDHSTECHVLYTHPRIQCRLDFFLVSQSTANITTFADIVPGYKTDHSMITVRLSLHSIPRGPGFWKLNTSFLTELEYVNQIKTTIQETYDEYKDDESVNPSLLWEMIKLKVREKSLRYSKIKTKQTKQRELSVEQTIAKLQEEFVNINTDDRA